MPIYIHTPTNTQTCTNIYIHSQTHTHIRTHIYIYTHINSYMYINTHIHTYTHTHKYLLIYIHTHIHVQTYICIVIHTCTHTCPPHTYTHMHAYFQLGLLSKVWKPCSKYSEHLLGLIIVMTLFLSHGRKQGSCENWPTPGPGDGYTRWWPQDRSCQKDVATNLTRLPINQGWQFWFW